MEKYAQLNLYFGITDSKGLPEVGFEKLKGNDNYSRQRIEGGMKIANESIQSAVDGREFPRLEYGFERFVNNEKEARNLINFLTERIKGVEERLELSNVAHGNLRFFRTVIINGINSKNSNELIEIFKESKKNILFSKDAAINYIDNPNVLSNYLRFYNP